MKGLGFVWIAVLVVMGSMAARVTPATAMVNQCQEGCWNDYSDGLFGCGLYSLLCGPLAPECFFSCAAGVTGTYYGCMFRCSRNNAVGCAPDPPHFDWDGPGRFYRVNSALLLRAGRWQDDGFLQGQGNVMSARFYALDLDSILVGGNPNGATIEERPWTFLGDGTFNPANSRWEVSAVLPPNTRSQGYVLRVDFEDSVYGTQLGSDFMLLQQCGGPVGWSAGPPQGLPARYGHAACFFDVFDGVDEVMFGGYDGTNALGDTWTSDGQTWTQVFPAHSPSARYGASMVFDRERDRLFLHGGYNPNAGYLNDTWSWDGTDWTLVATNGPPYAWSGMAYDSDLGRTVLYGGAAVGGRSRDTWEFDGTNWTLITNNSPPGYRSFHSMVYDEVAHHIHMFGGQLPGGVETNSNWAYKSGVWTNLGDGGPSPRRGQQMTYRPSCGTILLYGGEKDGAVYGDTWEWVGAWRLLSPNGLPPAPRYLASLTCTPDDRVVLFGGQNGGQYYSDTEVLGYYVDPADAPSPPTPVSTTRLETRPNPFGPSTTVRFSLRSPGSAHLSVYDTGGRRVAALVDGERSAGVHSISWNGTDDHGARLPSGLYLLRLETSDGVATSRVSMIR